MDMGLKGRTAVVTGGSRGIGFAVAEAFLAEGARVFICSRNRDALCDALKRLGELSAAEGMEADATVEKDVYSVAANAYETFGSLDCWVNNVGASFPRSGEEYTQEDEDYLKRNVNDTLLRRVALPDEIASPVVFLCSRRSSYITGASLDVSGGRGIVLNPEYSYVKKERLETSE